MHNERVDVKIVAFWSQKYTKRARREHEKVLEHIAALTSNCISIQSEHGNSKHFSNSFNRIYAWPV